MKIYEFGKKKPRLRFPEIFVYSPHIPQRTFTAMGPRRLTFSQLGQHQVHPGDAGCNMNREISLWRPQDLEKETS